MRVVNRDKIIIFARKIKAIAVSITLVQGSTYVVCPMVF
jgi:hypothetical protein